MKRHNPKDDKIPYIVFFKTQENLVQQEEKIIIK